MSDFAMRAVVSKTTSPKYVKIKLPNQSPTTSKTYFTRRSMSPEGITTSISSLIKSGKTTASAIITPTRTAASSSRFQ